MMAILMTAHRWRPRLTTQPRAIGAPPIPLLPIIMEPAVFPLAMATQKFINGSIRKPSSLSFPAALNQRRFWGPHPGIAGGF